MDAQDPGVPGARSELCRRIARASATLCGALCGLALVGWEFVRIPDVGRLYAIMDYPSPQAMAGLLLCAGSLVLRMNPGRAPRALAVAAGLAAAALGAGAQLEWALGRDLGLSGLLTTEAGRELVAGFTGRMSHGGSALVLLLAVCVLLHRAQGRRCLVVTSVCTPLALFLSLVAVLGFLFSVPNTSPFWGTVGMALPTSAAGLILAASVILSRPDRPLMAMVISPMAGGYLARRVLLAGMVLPLVVAVVEFGQVPSEWLGQAAAAAVEVVASMAVLAVVVLVTCSALNRSDERRRAAEASRALMMDELDHRVKNTLATVLAVCEHTMAGARDMRGFQEAFRGRIRAMASAHEALAAQRWEGVRLRRMVEATVAPFAGRGAPLVRLRGPEVLLGARAALPVVATLHELATNAAKHGALAGIGRGAGVDITWTIEGAGTIVLDWVEPATSPGAGPAQGNGGGFGTSLIRGLIAHELKGSTDLIIDESGVRCRMVIPGGGRAVDAEARP